MKKKEKKSPLPSIYWENITTCHTYCFVELSRRAIDQTIYTKPYVIHDNELASRGVLGGD